MNRLALPITGLFLLVIGGLVAVASLQIFERCMAPARFNVCY
jgi:hypothetical protein